MGFDCTLHAVDEEEISGKLVPALVSGMAPKKAFEGKDRVLWKQTMRSLAEDSPEDAASIVCQLALIFASQSHPYHYERGFALSLWPRQPDGKDVTFPKELIDSPESLFSGLVKKYPKLGGQFPTEFSGNWSAGVFIPAKKIPKALKWVENQVNQYEEGDKRLFRGLLLVLQHCVKQKLAYWEGTDLPIPLAKMSPEGGKNRRAERSFKWPDDEGCTPLCRQGNSFVCSRDDQTRTVIADFSVWPPSLHWLPEYSIDAAFSPKGKLVTVAAKPEKYFYSVRLRSNPTEKTFETLALPDSSMIGENGYESCAFLGEQVVSMLWYERNKSPKRYPLFQQGKHLVEDKSFRPARDLHKSSSDWANNPEDESLVIRVVRTGDGSEVLIWGEHGFELSGDTAGASSSNRFRKTFTLAGAADDSDWTSVSAGPDGFFYIGERLLYEIHRGASSILHLPKITNIMEVRPGPDSSLLLKEGDNKPGDWGKIYWPEARQIIRLKPDLIPEMDPDDLRHMFWLEDKRQLLAFFDEEVWHVPWEEIEKLPRTKV